MSKLSKYHSPKRLVIFWTILKYYTHGIISKMLLQVVLLPILTALIIDPNESGAARPVRHINSCPIFRAASQLSESLGKARIDGLIFRVQWKKPNFYLGRYCFGDSHFAFFHDNSPIWCDLWIGIPWLMNARLLATHQRIEALYNYIYDSIVLAVIHFCCFLRDNNNWRVPVQHFPLAFEVLWRHYSFRWRMRPGGIFDRTKICPDLRDLAFIDYANIIFGIIWANWHNFYQVAMLA